MNAAKASGTHTPEDDIMVHKKAHAIINCYIDSGVYPRVQVSVWAGDGNVASHQPGASPAHIPLKIICSCTMAIVLKS